MRTNIWLASRTICRLATFFMFATSPTPHESFSKLLSYRECLAFVGNASKLPALLFWKRLFGTGRRRSARSLEDTELNPPRSIPRETQVPSNKDFLGAATGNVRRIEIADQLLALGRPTTIAKRLAIPY